MNSIAELIVGKQNLEERMAKEGTLNHTSLDQFFKMGLLEVVRFHSMVYIHGLINPDNCCDARQLIL